MDYNDRYKSMLECPIHSKVPDAETKRYENIIQGAYLHPEKMKENIYLPAFAVMQAVNLGREAGQVGVKAFDTPAGWRAVSIFPTREDARAYLLDVLDTVKREQKMGLRTERNLDPKYKGGLDFRISPVFIVVARKPLIVRGWHLSTTPAVDGRRKLTHTGNKGRKRKKSTS